ncbi:hypothetical protein K431DRAFT_42310 [Polychaeton citri CBS 116435]|uniref:Uncharacterized protein n=1 Tax=Polychaeton citri CBS 116435 TaxID=1314669 RepID=A0A9P4QCW3_9PEZI|nr:hypothetical protein K431DRAFT_42310 [Polychaeton citri CBS 116435]
MNQYVPPKSCNYITRHDTFWRPRLPVRLAGVPTIDDVRGGILRPDLTAEMISKVFSIASLRSSRWLWCVSLCLYIGSKRWPGFGRAVGTVVGAGSLRCRCCCCFPSIFLSLVPD